MNKTVFLSAIFIVVFAGLSLQNCVQPPDYVDAPVIEMKSISKNIMKQGKSGEDSVLVVLTYTDGDGDLGSSSDEPDVFIKDGRDDFLKYQYRLPYVEPQGTGNGISGEISLLIPTSCCTFVDANGFVYSCEIVPVAFDTLTYLISIKDRAGNISNEVETPPITLICKD